MEERRGEIEERLENSEERLGQRKWTRPNRETRGRKETRDE